MIQLLQLCAAGLILEVRQWHTLDFCISQKEGESISNFIRQLKRTFQLAYRWDGMLPKTRDALLYSQLQEGLPYGGPGCF